MSQHLTTSPLPFDERPSLQRVWGLMLVLGLVSVVVGLVAISSVFVATLASVMVLGGLLVIVGITEVIHAITVRNLKGFAIHLLSAAIYLVGGIFMLEDPVQAAAVLTLIISAALFVAGVLRIVIAATTQFHGWSWVMFNGVVDLVLAGMILAKWPDSSLWVIGLFVGIDLMLQGWSWVFLALTVRAYDAPRPTVA